MINTQILKRLFIPTAVLIKDQSDCNKKTMCRANDLPLYCPDEKVQKKEQNLCQDPSTLEKVISAFRKSACENIDTVKGYEKQCKSYYNQGKQQVEEYVAFLQEENNTTPKYGAIAVGGLSGIILGLRGGWFKRTIYGTTGALIMAAVCYPKEAKEYSQDFIKNGKEYTTIAYNFINGTEEDGILTTASSYIDTIKTTLGLRTKEECDAAKEKVNGKMNLSHSQSDDECDCPGVILVCPPNSITCEEEEEEEDECENVEEESEGAAVDEETKIDAKRSLCSQCQDGDELEPPKYEQCVPGDGIDGLGFHDPGVSNISAKLKPKSATNDECYSAVECEHDKEEKVKVKKDKKKTCKKEDEICASIC